VINDNDTAAAQPKIKFNRLENLGANFKYDGWAINGASYNRNFTVKRCWCFISNSFDVAYGRLWTNATTFGFKYRTYKMTDPAPSNTKF
jgi:hypothetical protein